MRRIRRLTEPAESRAEAGARSAPSVAGTFVDEPSLRLRRRVPGVPLFRGSCFGLALPVAEAAPLGAGTSREREALPPFFGGRLGRSLVVPSVLPDAREGRRPAERPRRSCRSIFGGGAVGRTRALIRAGVLRRPNSDDPASAITATSISEAATPRRSAAACRASVSDSPVVSTHSISTTRSSFLTLLLALGPIKPIGPTRSRGWRRGLAIRFRR